MTLTEKRWLQSIERNPHSRSKQTMEQRRKLCLACLRIAARRHLAAKASGAEAR